MRVIDHLTVGNILVDYLEESDRPVWDSPTFRSSVPLNITAIVLSGDVTSYTFYIEGQTVTSTSHYISHTFFVVSGDAQLPSSYFHQEPEKSTVYHLATIMICILDK